MANTRTTVHGKIEVSPQAVSRVASRAALDTYGVVGLTYPHLRDGLVEVLQRESHHKGVEIRQQGEQLVVDLYVVVEYGTPISEVARNIASGVKFAVEKALGQTVAQVNINVKGLRVSDRD
ncbi:MAG: Asp23/Gls24 family envelope stress response protein [Chloroflexi bacterium]|nr:Asp23/Gls24 family envelope stress response protein [Chloroflexota bacterium]MCL5108493.1 Asp23/Gls24 family envelope stress response protein [Chloroflexota bacterium]